MSAKYAAELERRLIEAIRREARGAGDRGVATGTLVSKVGEELDVPAVEVRGAIWRLVDLQKIEFTEGRRLKLGPDQRAA